MGKTFKSLLLLLVVSLLFSTIVFGKNEQANKSLVALGDSIPYGYNLDESNDEPSKLAFPYLIGNEANLRVRNLAVPGWTTDQMLSALEDQKFRQAVIHADYITLNIGSNDLLRPVLEAIEYAKSASQGDPIQFEIILANQLSQISREVQTLVPSLVGKVGVILTEIRNLNPSAPIVVYNIYNPFIYQHPLLNSLANQVLPKLNASLVNHLSIVSNVVIADANSILTEQQDVFFGDIHPTIQGQEKLARLGLEALGY